MNGTIIDIFVFLCHEFESSFDHGANMTDTDTTQRPAKTEYTPKQPMHMHRSCESAAVDLENERDQIIDMVNKYIERSNKLSKELREIGKIEAHRKIEFMNDLIEKMKSTLYIDSKS